MNIDLSGKTAFVSGSTKGIGRAIAAQLARQGAAVMINGRTQASVDTAVNELRDADENAEVFGVAADCSTAAGVEAVLKAAPEVDILVNNVGFFDPKPFFDLDDDDWTGAFDVNVMSGVRLSRAYAPGMKEKGWGRIVFISSESALNIPTEMVQYGMTKTAQLAVARGLAQTLRGTGVTVNSVLPGPTKSEGVIDMMEGQRKDGESVDEAGVRFVRENRPTSIIDRMAEVQEVANMVGYVCSPAASATTGAGLRVDGGVVGYPV
ncbi:SDR family NAD(P)-dependent oxidoreductase [Euryhalocaulis caribicus]|uniref:SDR family NAD(P)-dependent oxidoreductase n=1 Tax=Euryhalocaulis caribicus TaxID=1161401 RepID=UPI00039CE4FC|nr:SDR family oxidoreductase [Euryhalocaulis caribicus]